jgi:hypothetical protein
MLCKLPPVSIRKPVPEGNANVRQQKAAVNFKWYTNGLW